MIMPGGVGVNHYYGIYDYGGCQSPTQRDSTGSKRPALAVHNASRRRVSPSSSSPVGRAAVVIANLLYYALHEVPICLVCFVDLLK